ncbi:hypothetical protein ALT761_03241 [Alteromonas sp. 76-1]|jgi:hypothetical protein|uniref:hypothetical protein n=1 Tax=Alteromonas TaxID=226 RepID=UPI000FD16D79|nr:MULTISPECIES: hypothetical protein [Alteromonas]MCQ8848352.1 hypothetical protein [Alteromonas stellipolaris]VEL98224.1 hypothetical protein ALT761_03241 [Alteromonas sp. 76-1]
MIKGTSSLPPPLNILVSRALKLCELVLSTNSVFYPFAAIYEDGKVGCLFSEETNYRIDESQLIECLQWRIIDTTTDSESYSILVYAAMVETQKHTRLDAIAISAACPNDEEQLLLYPYYRVGDKIVVSPPINTMPE